MSNNTGHNSMSVAAEELRQIVTRIENLEAEKKAISDDIKDVYGESKGRGFDNVAIRKIVKMRKQDANKRAEEETILALYCQALGMQTELPL